MPAATTISAIAAIGGLAMSAMGAAQQASAQQAQANYRAQVERNNARIARQNAAQIEKEGKVAEQERMRLIRSTLGNAKARQARMGFLIDDPDPDSTNVLLLADLAEQGQLDILTIRRNSLSEQRRAINQGRYFTAQADLYKLQSDQFSPFGSAAGTLLSGAGSVIEKSETAGFFG